MIWWCRSDPINFSMLYSQIADLTVTLCIPKSLTARVARGIRDEFQYRLCIQPLFTNIVSSICSYAYFEPSQRQ